MDLHGGNIYRIKGGENLLDFSANINPLGVPESLKELIKYNLESLINYPEPDYRTLRGAIGSDINIPIDNILVGNGAVELIFLYIKALKPKKTLILAPTFAEYNRALELVESKVDYISYRLDNGAWSTPVNGIKEALKEKHDLVVICNPNNPTGHLTDLGSIREIAQEANKYNTNLLIDEAFIDFLSDGEDFSAKNLQVKNIFVVRAFTKFYAIPGLRLGYGICFDEKMIANMEKIKEPWTLNTFASLGGPILLRDKGYREKTLKWIEEEKLYLYRKLAMIDGVEVYKPSVNFILLKLLNGQKSHQLRDMMIKDGVIIRDCQNFEFLDEYHIRLAIKDRKSNDMMVEVLKSNLVKNKNQA